MRLAPSWVSAASQLRKTQNARGAPRIPRLRAATTLRRDHARTCMPKPAAVRGSVSATRAWPRRLSDAGT
jgi:hypothetical protein